jgi:hypothetical protein
MHLDTYSPPRQRHNASRLDHIGTADKPLGPRYPLNRISLEAERQTASAATVGGPIIGGGAKCRLSGSFCNQIGQ